MTFARSPASHRNSEAGFSLAELAVAGTILLMLALAVGRLTDMGGRAQDHARRMNRVTEVGQNLMDDIRGELMTSVQLFGNDAVGNAHVALLELGAAPPPIGTSLLPTFAPSGEVQRDTVGNEITGNSLCFARLAWTDDFTCTSGNGYRIDVFRIVYYYQTVEDGGPQPDRASGLNLVRFITEPLVDGSQIDRISDPTDQAEVLVHLATATPDATGRVRSPAVVVWLRGGDLATAGTLREIDPSTGLLDDVPSITRSTWSFLPGGRNGIQSLLSFRHHSVATNYARFDGTVSIAGVARFGLRNNSGDGFPHGFEVQAVGPSAGRKVLLYMVLVGTQRGVQLATSAQQAIVDVRDQ